MTKDLQVNCIITTFTFQSGSIQMTLCKVYINRVFYLYIPIWFYSNDNRELMQSDIQQLYIPIWFYSNENSAAVSYKSCRLYIPIWFYSNDHLSHFLFDIYRLYIPIWFYSNKSGVRKQIPWKNAFTFQSGSIQILWDLAPLLSSHSLHSNLVLFKSCVIQKDGSRTFTLHSNLVLFKFCKASQIGGTSATLHSNLVLFKSVHIIPPIYAAWKALFCRPINKCFL